jgi:hypothetical protein
MLLSWSDTSLGVGTLAPGGRSFETTGSASGNGQLAFGPLLVLPSDQATVVVWGVQRALAQESPSTVDVATAPTGAPFGMREELATAERITGAPAVAAFGDSAIVAWSVTAKHESLIRTARRQQDGSFSRPALLAHADRAAGWVLTSDDSQALIAWVWHGRLQMVVI